ncbi:MAG: hypothetical protein RLZZ262_1056 [Bacteroidota bacterium]
MSKPTDEILLLTPPLTQLNTPYPATAYLSGFLQSKGIPSRQGDLGLDLVLRIFNRQGLLELFNAIEDSQPTLVPHLQSILSNRKRYEDVIDTVIGYLQRREYTIGNRIARRNYLPEGERFAQLPELDSFFGQIGVQDKARYICTLMLEDLGDLIQATVGPHFGFSKYAERIAQTAVSFDPIEQALQQEENYFDRVLLQALSSYFEYNTPKLIAFTVPFPGNLYGALKCGQWIKKHYPETKIAMGGGYPNTELRSLSDPRVFDYVDYITLDDGEAPIELLWQHLNTNDHSVELKRTYCRKDGQVVYLNSSSLHDYPAKLLPAPSYDGLRLDAYLSMYDVPNPMHRLWNDGRWNKLTMAHGCYWKKCSFCDITLDYIGRYDPTPAKELVDKMELLIEETGETGFHFVDEAAPPLAMRDVALEILRRGLQVSWWANIRFEKTFTIDLCELLAASGCIAVTGGLEVADERLLALIEKGITIEQVVQVTRAFRDSGILVHAYLMYGFPTQTDQETIDSLEIVRQLFQNGLLQSAYWHRFAMTAHSPVGKDPAKYGVECIGPEFKGFAQNDLHHIDPSGADHDKYSDGLIKALYNFMHNKGLDFPVGDFFDFLVPHPEVPNKLVAKILKRNEFDNLNNLGYRCIQFNVKRTYITKGNQTECTVRYKNESVSFSLPNEAATYLQATEESLQLPHSQGASYTDWVEGLAAQTKIKPEDVVKTSWYNLLRKHGLWVIKYNPS